jgi:hypothetical protein
MVPFSLDCCQLCINKYIHTWLERGQGKKQKQDHFQKCVVYSFIDVFTVFLDLTGSGGHFCSSTYSTVVPVGLFKKKTSAEGWATANVVPTQDLFRLFRARVADAYQ